MEESPLAALKTSRLTSIFPWVNLLVDALRGRQHSLRPVNLQEPMSYVALLERAICSRLSLMTTQWRAVLTLFASTFLSFAAPLAILSPSERAPGIFTAFSYLQSAMFRVLLEEAASNQRTASASLEGTTGEPGFQIQTALKSPKAESNP